MLNEIYLTVLFRPITGAAPTLGLEVSIEA